MTLRSEMSCNTTVVSMQMNGTLDVRDVFKEALGESRGRHFTRGTDAHKFFSTFQECITKRTRQRSSMHSRNAVERNHGQC